MPRYSGNPTTFAVAGQTFTFPPRVVDDFADARPFLEALLTRGSLAAATAKLYVQQVARLRRSGRLGDINLLHNRIDRTAANAYARWKAESYDARIVDLARALGRSLPKREALRYLRVHALVAPFEGKTIAVHMPAPASPAAWEAVRDRQDASVQPMVVVHQPTNAWTLHVPNAPGPAHIDPCESCFAIELTHEQLAAIGEAFKAAWGHYDILKVPNDAYMFGEPPPVSAAEHTTKRGDYVVALSGATTTSEELVRMGAVVARSVDPFVERLKEGRATGVYLSRETVGARLPDVLAAISKAWEVQP